VNGWEIAGLLIGGGGLFGFLGVVVTTRASRKHDRATEQQGQFQNDLEFRKYVDGVVRDAVANATKPLNEQIETQNGQIAAQDEQIRQRDELIAKFSNKDRIMSWFVQRLYWWDDGGRNGAMPRLTYDEQNALDLDLFPEQTQPGRPNPSS
jgi:hypothetical protein